MTTSEVNALPDRIRQYIHDLETRCDHNGEVRQIWILREQNEQLQEKVKNINVELKDQRLMTICWIAAFFGFWFFARWLMDETLKNGIEIGKSYCNF